MQKSKDEIKKAVRDHYGKAITQKNSCCAPASDAFDEQAAGRFAEMAGYTKPDLSDMPELVTSFGCGNPTSAIDIQEGQTVLDLGSGSGLDMILAARKVGPTGRVIGLDMTDEMIASCRKNLAAAGVENAEVRNGEMEQMPVADGEVDWIISNCVINLSPEKPRVFAESFRVLKPEGRVLISDIVTLNLSDELRDDMGAWVGCIGGAIDQEEFIRLMEEAGFQDVRVVDKIVYDGPSLNVLANDTCGCGPGDDCTVDKAVVDKYAGKVASIKLSARKPGE